MPAWTRRATALLAAGLLSWLVVATAFHGADDPAGPGHHADARVAVAGGEAETADSTGQSIAASCPSDCPNPTHHHSGHDHSTCAACQAFGRPALREAHLEIPPALALSRERLQESFSIAVTRVSSCSAPRGPPTC